jgi:Raf kinase inhibitor-like YbhB/YbcL family protein
MEISMPNFTAGGILPAKYTVDGAGVSPELNWRDVPKDCKSLVLICEDPDAPLGLWTHWIVYNLPPNATGLVEGVRDLPAGAQFGLNTIQEPSYCPPAPPKGEHRYYFKLYALDVVLDLKKPTRDELMKAMKGHIVVQASLLTKYQRPF